METTAVLLAAGEGKRMKSRLPKVMHAICGRDLLGHVLAAAQAVSQRQVIVVGHGREQVMRATGTDYLYAIQDQQLGTGHAVKTAREYLDSREVLVLCGDTPLIDSQVLESLLKAHREEGALGTVLTAKLSRPAGYGRIIRGDTGNVSRIVEERDASAEERKIREINTGTYCFDGPALMRVLDQLSTDNAQGEYYLTDVMEILAREGKTTACLLADQRLALGVNSREELAEAARVMRELINKKLMAAGVTMVDPLATYVDVGVSIGGDTIIHPNTIIEGNCSIGRGCILGPNSRLTNAVLGEKVTLYASVIRDSTVSTGSSIGPFAYISRETDVGGG